MNTARSVDPRITAGISALAAMGLLVGGAFVGLLVEGIGDAGQALASFDGYLLRITLFTLWQATFSTLLSIVPAILVARALSRHPAFPGRATILRLFALPLALPAIVAALGLLSLFGTAGYLAQIVGAMTGGTWPGIYGLSGILIAHVFFNLPLATRLFLEALNTVSADQWRLASQLGMGAGPSFRNIEWPVLRASLPSVAGLVFMLCVTSFTLVLTLGGGPRATTLEVAIYQSLRFDFDPARAVALTLLQIALTVAVIAVLVRLGANIVGDANLGVAQRRPKMAARGEAIANGVVAALAVLFVVGPMLAIVIAGLQADLARLAGEGAVQRAALTSIAFATASAILCIILSLALVSARHALAHQNPPRRLLEKAMDAGAGFVLIIPPIVIGAGWFMLLRQVTDVFALAPIMVISVNAMMAVPFAVRAIRPLHDAAATRHERLCSALGINGWNRARLIDLPVLRRAIAMGAVFAMALSLGDLGVVALFGSDSVQTLPYLLLGRMGSYRTADAAGIALLLGLLCLGLMTLADWLGRERRT